MQKPAPQKGQMQMKKIQDKRKGNKPSKRKLATPNKDKKLTANQWKNTPQQQSCMEYWLKPTSPTFGNMYLSALKAGYAPSYAIQISAPSINNKWIQEYTNQVLFTQNHIEKLLQDLATNPDSFSDSKSPADTRIKALEVLSKVKGIMEQGKTQINNIQMTPILGGQTTNQSATPNKESIDITI